MKVLVSGDRKWNDAQLVFDTLDWYDQNVGRIDTIIEGCYGNHRYNICADHFAFVWADAHGRVTDHHPADWAKYHLGAGPRRNAEMARLMPDLVLCFHDNITSSKGTADMKHKAEKLGLHVEVIDHKSVRRAAQGG